MVSKTNIKNQLLMGNVRSHLHRLSEPLVKHICQHTQRFSQCIAPSTAQDGFSSRHYHPLWPFHLKIRNGSCLMRRSEDPHVLRCRIELGLYAVQSEAIQFVTKAVLLNGINELSLWTDYVSHDFVSAEVRFESEERVHDMEETELVA